MLTYVSFSDQKVELTTRKEELDKGRNSIKDLIDALDMRKDEAIERTFKTVARNFKDIHSISTILFILIHNQVGLT